MKIFEQENFIPDYECKHLLWYQKNNASNDKQDLISIKLLEGSRLFNFNCD